VVYVVINLMPQMLLVELNMYWCQNPFFLSLRQLKLILYLIDVTHQYVLLQLLGVIWVKWLMRTLLLGRRMTVWRWWWGRRKEFKDIITPAIWTLRCSGEHTHTHTHKFV